MISIEQLEKNLSEKLILKNGLSSLIRNSDLFNGSADALQVIGVSDLTLNSVQISRPVDYSVTVSGTAQIIDVSQSLSIKVQIQQNGSITQEWTFSPTLPNWNFKNCFSNLPNCTGVSNNGISLIERDSFFYELVFNHPTFIIKRQDKGEDIYCLTFQGSLTPSSQNVFGQTIKAIVGSKALTVIGQIDLSGQIPIISLSAPLPQLRISLSKFSLENFSLLFKTKNTNLPGSEMGLSGSIHFAAVQTEISTPLLQGNFVWPLLVNFEDNALSLKNGFQDLESLLGIDIRGITFPKGLEALGAFYFSSVTLGFDPKKTSLSFITVVGKTDLS